MLLLFMIYSAVIQITHFVTILFVAMNIISVIALLSGTGLFFGTLFSKTSSATIANIVLAAALWAVIPFLPGSFGHSVNDMEIFYRSMVPYYQAAIVMDISNFQEGLSALEYRWPAEKLGPGMTFLMIFVSTILHLSAGVFFAWCAKQRLRKNIFQK